MTSAKTSIMFLARECRDCLSMASGMSRLHTNFKLQNNPLRSKLSTIVPLDFCLLNARSICNKSRLINDFIADHNSPNNTDHSSPSRESFNPLHPSIDRNILHSVLNTFHMVLTGTICLTVKNFFT